MEFVIMAAAVGSGVTGTIGTRLSQGFRRWRWAVTALIGYTVATLCMAWLLQRLPAGIVYAVWSGVAATVLLAVDRFIFRERVSRVQVIGTIITLIGVVLLSTVIA